MHSVALPHWPWEWRGVQAVFFDCDSTLAALEGIDELGRRRGVDVAALTRASMAGELPLEEVYAQRLDLVRPAAEDLAWLAGRYREEEVPGARETVQALEVLGVACHLISGGLLPAVAPFAAELGFLPERVHAVPYDPADPAAAAAHPLARAGGKPEVIAAVSGGAAPREERMLVGDGASDLEAAPEVRIFVGFGGVAPRPEVRARSPIFLKACDLAPVAVLAAGPKRWNDLAGAAPGLFARGCALLSDPASTEFPCPTT